MRRTRIAPLLAALAVTTPWARASADGLGTADPAPQPVTGGQDAQTCAWPTALAVFNGSSLCTGTLVHPEIVVFAGHCADGNINFGGSAFSPAQTIATEYCKWNPQSPGPGAPGNFARMDASVEWIESASGVDITPCHTVDGTWQPGPDCQGFIASGPEGHGGWSNWCEGTPSSGPSATCGEPFGADPDDVAPNVTITSPSDGTSFEPGSATVSIEIDADDGDGWGIKEVRLEINGEQQSATDTNAPFSFENVAFPEGLWEIVAIAEDLAGNVGSSEPVTIGVGVDVPEDEDDGGSDDDDGDTGDGGDGGDDAGGDWDPQGPDLDASDNEGCACVAGPDRQLVVLLPLLLVVAARRRGGRAHPSGGGGGS